MATVMAVLPSNDRAEVTAEIMRSIECPGTITKAQLRAVVDAVDQWADDNATAFNQAIPQPQRGILTARQKALVLAFVCLRRHTTS